MGQGAEVGEEGCEGLVLGWEGLLGPWEDAEMVGWVWERRFSLGGAEEGLERLGFGKAALAEGEGDAGGFDDVGEELI